MVEQKCLLRAGDRSTIDTARKVVDLLEEMGHEVFTRHLVSDNAGEADRLTSPQDVFKRDMGWLGQCEFSHRGSLRAFLRAGI